MTIARPVKTAKRPYWYMHCVGECPVCGRSASYRVRVYGPKPKDARKRIVHLPDTVTYDNCMG